MSPGLGPLRTPARPCHTLQGSDALISNYKRFVKWMLAHRNSSHPRKLFMSAEMARTALGDSGPQSLPLAPAVVVHVPFASIVWESLAVVRHI